MTKTHSAGSVVVITGANAGLGYHCAYSLAATADGPIIVLACRRAQEAEKAADAIAHATGCDRSRLVVLPTQLDLTECGSVRLYAAALRSWLEERKFSISALVNNAGIGAQAKFTKNSAGAEWIFATNHLGHFLLTLLLLPFISSVVINVSRQATILYRYLECLKRSSLLTNVRPLQRGPRPGEQDAAARSWRRLASVSV